MSPGARLLETIPTLATIAFTEEEKHRHEDMKDDKKESTR